MALIYTEYFNYLDDETFSKAVAGTKPPLTEAKDLYDVMGIQIKTRISHKKKSYTLHLTSSPKTAVGVLMGELLSYVITGEKTALDYLTKLLIFIHMVLSKEIKRPQ